MKRTYSNNQLHGLPTAYQELLWIKTDGAAAFKVSFVLKNNNPGFIIRCFIPSTTSCTSNFYLFGVYASSGYTDWGFIRYPDSSSGAVYFRKACTTNNNSYALNFPYTQTAKSFIQQAKVTTTSNVSTITKFDGTTATSDTDRNRYDLGQYIGVGNRWNGTSSAFFTTTLTEGFYLQYLALYKGTTLAYELIPCRRKSDNKIGMYDKVNSVFYASETGTEFTAGNPA